jgi:hypothetical protein
MPVFARSVPVLMGIRNGWERELGRPWRCTSRRGEPEACFPVLGQSVRGVTCLYQPVGFRTL